LYTLCTDTPQFMAVRLLNGFGFAAYTVTAMTMVVDISPRGRLGEILGIYAISLLAAQSLGPSISGFLLSGFGYFPTFYFIGLLGLSATFIAIRIKVAPPASPAGEEESFTTVLHNRNLITSCIAIVVVMIPHGLIIGFFPLYAINQGVGPEAIGLFFTVFALGLGCIRPIVGVLSDRLGRVPLIVPFALLSAVGVTGFALLDGIGGFLVSGATFGIGLGASHSALSALSVDTIKPKLRGQAVGVYGTAIELGISAGAICMGPVILYAGYQTAFFSSAMIVVFGIVAFLGIRALWKKEEIVYT